MRKLKKNSPILEMCMIFVAGGLVGGISNMVMDSNAAIAASCPTDIEAYVIQATTDSSAVDDSTSSMLFPKRASISGTAYQVEQGICGRFVELANGVSDSQLNLCYLLEQE